MATGEADVWLRVAGGPAAGRAGRARAEGGGRRGRVLGVACVVWAVAFLAVCYQYRLRFPRAFVSYRAYAEPARALGYSLRADGMVSDEAGTALESSRGIVGYVESVGGAEVGGGRVVRVSGLVLDAASPRRPVRVLVFRSGKLVAAGWPAVRRADFRPEVAGPRAAEGFSILMDGKFVAQVDGTYRVFGLDGDGRVAELKIGPS